MLASYVCCRRSSTLPSYAAVGPWGAWTLATYVASPSPMAAAGCSPAQQQRQQAPAGCAICLSDFADGERICRVLPVCGHRFHIMCIDRCPVSHRCCPTCRRRLSSVSIGGHDRLQVLTAV